MPMKIGIQYYQSVLVPDFRRDDVWFPAAVGTTSGSRLPSGRRLDAGFRNLIT